MIAGSMPPTCSKNVHLLQQSTQKGPPFPKFKQKIPLSPKKHMKKVHFRRKSTTPNPDLATCLDKAGSLPHSLFIQGCLGSFTCLSPGY